MTLVITEKVDRSLFLEKKCLLAIFLVSSAVTLYYVIYLKVDTLLYSLLDAKCLLILPFRLTIFIVCAFYRKFPLGKSCVNLRETDTSGTHSSDCLRCL